MNKSLSFLLTVILMTGIASATVTIKKEYGCSFLYGDWERELGIYDKKASESDGVLYGQMTYGYDKKIINSQDYTWAFSVSHNVQAYVENTKYADYGNKKTDEWSKVSIKHEGDELDEHAYGVKFFDTSEKLYFGNI